MNSEHKGLGRGKFGGGGQLPRASLRFQQEQSKLKGSLGSGKGKTYLRQNFHSLPCTFLQATSLYSTMPGSYAVCTPVL